MSGLIPGQYTQFLAQFWHLLIPMCPSCIAWRIFSLSVGGMMRASPQRMRSSSTVMMYLWPLYRHRAHGTSLILSGQPAMIISARQQRSGSSWMRVWNSYSVRCDVDMVDGDVLRYLWSFEGCIVRVGICNQHLFARWILDGDIMVLQMEQHSL